ncbi:GFA family protein [Gluconacetobacter diazotrophicus]|uniref:CENP-V/GFA domain-containing protein n=2 Tax=Gluconacetobacter diazotrophicus TaxID=33996 RepID=A9H6W3_GLUDA|nr:GFA family protein [Gluconacetobacter diazotrophicus]MBB2156783.1 GFA family protein [Gluconacetobacter diazotrophicus]CAP57559.1 conserved hypothetical protein [Gluconacetobacter diazotrophicus PA1 5]
MTENPPTLNGSCLCGAVTYRIDGAPLDFVLCHCGRCRKTTGSSFAANLIARPADLTWTSGHSTTGGHATTGQPDGVARWDLPTAASFATATCRVCGTPVPHATRNGRLMIVPAGTLDCDPGLTPRRQIFTASKAGWCIDVEDLPAES